MRRNPLLRGTAVVALLIAGLVASGASPAGAGSTKSATVFSVPLTIEPQAYTDVEACIGESITITHGAYRLVMTERDNQFLFHANTVDGIAVGNESGATYRIIGHQQEVMVSRPNAAFVDTFQLRLRVVGLSGAPSFSAHFFFHVTVTPTGSIALERGGTVITC